MMLALRQVGEARAGDAGHPAIFIFPDKRGQSGLRELA
jgi:hypothetical protein